MDNITLFHGTTRTHAENILKTGFSENTCFTTNESLAAYFAECANDEHQDDNGSRDIEVILSVSLPLSKIKVDWPAFEEPISIFRNEWAASDDLWFEGIENNSIPYPGDDHDVESAIESTTCVRCIEPVLPPQIKEI